jgi:hypothetical protein
LGNGLQKKEKGRRKNEEASSKTTDQEREIAKMAPG